MIEQPLSERPETRLVPLKHRFRKMRSTVILLGLAAGIAGALAGYYGGRELGRPEEPVTRIILTPRDEYSLLDRGQEGFNDESRKVMIPCGDLQSRKRLATFLVFGQSNSANHGGGEKIEASDHVFNFNPYTGHCALAGDPLLGPTGVLANFATRFGDDMVRSGRYSDVLIASIGAGGSFVEDWAPGGSESRRVPVVVQRLADAGFHVDYLLWHQGEANVDDTPESYVGWFHEMLRNIRAHGVNAPIFVPLASICGGPTGPNVRAAQAALVDPDQGIFPGPDTDSLGGSFRFDTCHISGEGLDRHAAMWLLTLERYQDRWLSRSFERVSNRDVDPALLAPHFLLAREAYNAAGVTTAILPAEIDKARASDGASIMGLQFSNRIGGSVAARLVLHVRASADTTLVTGLFREGSDRPVALHTQALKLGVPVRVEQGFLVPAPTGGATGLSVRVGIDQPGAIVFFNEPPADPAAYESSYVEATPGG